MAGLDRAELWAVLSHTYDITAWARGLSHYKKLAKTGWAR